MIEAEPPVVLVGAEQRAVGDAVAVALGAAGFRVEPVTLPVADGTGLPATADAGLLAVPLESHADIQDAVAVLAGGSLPWVVVSSTPSGPGWGAALEAGAAAVVDSAAAGLDSIVLLLRQVVAGHPVGDDLEAERLVGDWREHVESRQRLATRIAALSPDELERLRQVHRGDSCAEPESDELLTRLGLGSWGSAAGQLDGLLDAI